MNAINFILNTICLILFPLTFVFGLILFRNKFSTTYKIGKVYIWFTPAFGKKWLPVFDILI